MTLPGLEPPTPAVGALEKAAEETVAQLTAKELLRPEDALLVQLVRSAAQAVDRGLLASKPTVATTTLYRGLMDLLDRLPKDGNTDGDDGWWETFRNLGGIDTEVRA